MHVPPIYTVSQCYEKAVRLVFGASRLDHTCMLFYRCRVLRFKDLVKLKMCSILYKVHYNMPVPANVNCLFIKNTHVGEGGGGMTAYRGMFAHPSTDREA